MAINMLPEGVLLEILARLPVKSLLRFQSVSKSWRGILKEPFFVTKHQLTQVALNKGNCVLTRVDDEFALVTEDEQGVKCTRLELPFDIQHPQVAGPCNGIVAISDLYDDLFLWNPATREYKAFPSTSHSLQHGMSAVGFGIDPITKDYKAVRLWIFVRHPYEFIYKAEVISLSANSCRPKSESWKIIDAVLPISVSEPLFLSDGKVYLNGKYYWCTKSYERQCSILWFDMGAEVFGFIELPNLCPGPYYNKLVVFKGYLAMVRNACKTPENKYMYEIWIMDGIDAFSWTKYATVGPFTKFEVPIGFLKNEELVVLDYTCRQYAAFSYDIKTHVKKIIMQGGFLDMSPPFAIYNESLVSVVG